MFIVYGISNCDTIKKVLHWLKVNDVTFEFHDYKKHGITHKKLEDWVAQIDSLELLNRSGTTFKGLSASQKTSIYNTESIINLMIEYASCIKRPIIEHNGKIVKIGWKPEGIL